MDKSPIRLSQAIEGYFLAAQARRLAPGTLATLLSEAKVVAGRLQLPS